MKIRTLLMAMALTSGVSASAQATSDCRANSTISHQAVKAKSYKDAYKANMQVIENCPTMKYYTFTDAQKILTGLLSEITDKNSADYKMYFDQLMHTWDLRIQYIPHFAKRMKGVPSQSAALGLKAIDYINFAPTVDPKVAYSWLKGCVDAEGANTDPTVIHHFVDISKNVISVDESHKDVFFDDYLLGNKLLDEEFENANKALEDSTITTKERVKLERDLANIKGIRGNVEAFLINSGVASCESLQEIYGPKIEENKDDAAFLNKTVSLFKSLGCKESDAYFTASAYLYNINPSVSAAIGCAYMNYKKGDYNEAVKYFNAATELEKNDTKKAEIAYATAAALLQAKKYAQARNFCNKAISYNKNYGEPYILLANIYASSPNWSEEHALNLCTYYLVVQKAQRAKAIDPTLSEAANKIINNYSKHLPQAKDLFMLGYKPGDEIKIGGWIGETITVKK